MKNPLGGEFEFAGKGEGKELISQFSTWGFIVSFDCSIAAATLLFRLSL